MLVKIRISTNEIVILQYIDPEVDNQKKHKAKAEVGKSEAWELSETSKNNTPPRAPNSTKKCRCRTKKKTIKKNPI